jgi:hypothetical protein
VRLSDAEIEANKVVIGLDKAIAERKLKYQEGLRQDVENEVTKNINNITTKVSVPVGPDGKPVAGGSKPATENQAKAESAVDRMLNASKAIGKLDTDKDLNEIVKLKSELTLPRSASGVPIIGGLAGPVLGGLLEGQRKVERITGGKDFSDKENKSRSYLQAEDEWAEAYLRATTGAEATVSDTATVKNTFFPQPGDSPEVIKQKARARLAAQASIAKQQRQP